MGGERPLTSPVKPLKTVSEITGEEETFSENSYFCSTRSAQAEC